MFNLVPKAYAVSLGPIRGVGDFQFENTVVNEFALSNRISSLLSNIITVFTVVAGLAFVIYFMIGAFKWITSGGDQNKAEEAKKQLTQAAIGLIVVVASYFIIGIVGGVLGLDIFNPAATLGL